MKRIVTAVLAALVVLPLAAQHAPEADPAKTIVATINAETITLAQLNELYDSMNLQMRQQYDKNGGKSAFLDNYLRKRLLIQEAIKQGFDKRPDVLAAERAAVENALFERYVRDVVSKSVVSDAMVKQYYDEHQAEFNRPEQVKARHIIISFGGTGQHAKTKEQAAEQIKQVYDALNARIASAKIENPTEKLRFLIHEFDAAARLYSEDGTARTGGDLGWFGHGAMDPAFEKVAFSQQPGTLSAPFESPYGYHVVLVEAKRPAGAMSFDEVEPRIREALLAKHGAEILQRVTVLTNELRNSGKIAVFPENVQ